MFLKALLQTEVNEGVFWLIGVHKMKIWMELKFYVRTRQAIKL